MDNNFESRLNLIHFDDCEDVLVGDVLHYAYVGKKTVKTGIKDLIAIISKDSFISNYDFEIKGNGSNLVLFSSSYKDRKDHYNAFKDVVSIINNKLSVESISNKFDANGYKYFHLIKKWNKKLKEAKYAFGERMCILRGLFQAYKDYDTINHFIESHNIIIKNVLVYCDVMPVDCFVVQKYKAKGCKVITFHHGAFSIENNAWAYKKSKSDYFLADSHASCDDARQVGYAGNIIPVGSPFQFNSQEIKVEGPYTDKVFGVVMNSSVDPIEDNIEMIKTVQDYCKENGKTLYIKFHPADNSENYRNIIDNKYVMGQFFKEKTINDFIDLVDVVIVSSSTVIKTSLSKNKPTLIFVRKGFDTYKFRGTDEIKFSNKNELVKQVKKIEDGFTDIMIRQNENLNVLGKVKDNYKCFYSSIGIE